MAARSAVVCGLVVLSGLSGLLGAVGCRGKAEKLFEEAHRATAEDDFERAARAYLELTIQTPDSPLAPKANFELAQIYHLRFRDAEAARDCLIKILQDYPDAPVVVAAEELLARLYDEVLLEPEKALEHYHALLRHEIDEGVRRRTLLNIGHCYYERSELDAAADAYRLAVSLPYDPDSDGAYVRLANLEWITGSPEESLRLLEVLREHTKDPDRRHEALMREVEVLMSLGRFDEASDKLEDADTTEEHRGEREALRERILSARTELRSLDGEAEQALLKELQQKIRWGAGRRRRAPARSNE